MRKIQSVAIIGGGPAGAALATHLRRAGKTVAIFDTGRRPELVVGESLVPALIPLLQELGVEEEIAAVSTYKPGATFYTAPDKEVSFLFAQAGRRSPNYAYNVPRADFDAIVLQNAARNGAHIIPKLANLSLAAGSSRISLAEEPRRVAGSDRLRSTGPRRRRIGSQSHYREASQASRLGGIPKGYRHLRTSSNN